ncbi:MAG: glycosyltransferase family 4 protein [Actinomycetota bacterium]
MLNGELPPLVKGGVAYQVDRLARALAARGHMVSVISLTKGSSSAPYEVRQIFSPRWLREKTPWQLAVLPLAFGCASYRHFDVVHAHGDNPLLYRRKVPVVRTFYGSAREEARSAERFRRLAAQTLLIGSELLGRKLATITVGISQNTSNSLGGLDFIVPCGVDRRFFRPQPKSESPSILFVGTIFGRKRGAAVVRAFNETIHPRLPNAELWLVADVPVQGAGITSFGMVSDDEIRRLFSSAWIFTLPSTYEGFGVPYIEAMASGTAVVATPNLGAVELFAERSGGVLVGEDKLGETILRLLNDGDTLRELSKGGRQESASFDWNLIAARYEEIYELAMTRAKSSSG